MSASDAEGAEDCIPVAILLGGKGTRLGLRDIPKPMVSFLNRPLIENIVCNLRDQGLRNLVFLSGYLSEVIEQYFGDGSRFGVRIRYSVETEPLGTAPATRAATQMLGDEFLLVYGDVAFDIDIKRFLHRARSFGGDGTLIVHPNDHPHDSDLVVCDPVNHQISAFLNKPHAPGLLARNLVNAGIYYLKPTIFQAIPKGSGLFDWGRDVFPNAVRSGHKLFAYRTAEYLKDIGTPARLKRSEQHFQSGIVAARSMRLPQRAVFIDRDGVINREIDGVHNAQDMKCLDGVASTIAEINQSSMIAIGVTNQPDLAKGFFTFDDLENVHIEMDRQLAVEGGFLDDLLFCPHHPETGFPREVSELKIDCICRKPAPGLLLQAAELYNIELSESYMIGDRVTDLMAGRAVGAKTILVHCNGETNLLNNTIDLLLADHVTKDLRAAWEGVAESVWL